MNMTCTDHVNHIYKYTYIVLPTQSPEHIIQPTQLQYYIQFPVNPQKWILLHRSMIRVTQWAKWTRKTTLHPCITPK